MPLLERRRVVGTHCMISHVTLKKGCAVPVHSHANEQMVCVLSGVMRFTLGGGREEVVRAGGVLHLPPHAPHGVVADEDSVVIDVFSPVSETTGIDRR
jgi:quercetin dioxygenase-like cupin family protein